MTGDITSSAIDLDNFNIFSVSFIYTGIPTGTVKIEFSNDGATWVMPTGGSKATAGAAGSFTIDYDKAPAKWLRLVYDFTSDTGVLNAWYTLKGE